MMKNDKIRHRDSDIDRNGGALPSLGAASGSAIEVLCAALRSDGHEDDAEAVEALNWLIREYSIPDDRLTLGGQTLKYQLMAVIREWGSSQNAKWSEPGDKGATSLGA